MRTPVAAGLLGTALIVAVACSDDRPTATEPLGTTALARAGAPLDFAHSYQFTIKCTTGRWIHVSLRPDRNLDIYHTCPSSSDVLTTVEGNFTSFTYEFNVGAFPAGQQVCAGGATTTGTIKCQNGAYIKVADVGVQ
jgi:hypothetical protein